MKLLNVLITLIITISIGNAQNSIQESFTGGEIWTSGGSYDNTCQGSPAQITIQLPAGDQYEVTGIKITYLFQSVAPENPTAQRSRVKFLNNGNIETTHDSNNNTPGFEEYYSRSGVDIANGIYNGETELNFELEVWRDKNGPCHNTEQFISSNSWSIELNYSDEIPFKKVGISTMDPNQALHVAGKIEVGNDDIPPTDGTIMFHDNSFYGYANGQWNRLSQEKEILGISNVSSDGSFSYNGLTGLEAADQMCKDAFPDQPTARMYFSHDIDDAVLRGNISGVTTNTNYWTILHTFEGFSSTNSAQNNCYNFLNNNGGFASGTIVKFFLDTSPATGQPVGNYVSYTSNIGCWSSFPIVCGK